ncbi:hypothetical protein UFOVP383_26 [uncultured Caudovirales phage]|uniref:Uncharacterized protein n=1 Tax=uncultured Caudovirales phage TaxID=2100421 RepID=A0A6J7X2H8_9CAUD|nr:hypothetical protein UFOVP383_26 [uncultured Caudovirales phage]
MTPAEFMFIGGLIVGTIEAIIAALPIKPNSTVELVLAIAKAIFKTSLKK